MKRLLTLSALLMVLWLPALGSADVIYEYPAPVGSPGLTLGHDYWVAQLVHLDQSVAVKAISLYFTSMDTDADFFFNIYRQNLDEYKLEGLFAPIDFGTSGTGPGSYGASGLNLVLGPGNYWIGVGTETGSGTVPAGGNASGILVGSTPEGDITGNLDGGVGLKIEGDTIPTPEPSSWLLAATGLAAAAFLRRRFKA